LGDWLALGRRSRIPYPDRFLGRIAGGHFGSGLQRDARAGELHVAQIEAAAKRG